MNKVNLNELKEWDWKSPGGKYAARFMGISEALGRDPDSLVLTKRHPFDLELTRVPPGKPICLYHSHSAQWEFYLVVSGKGTVRTEEGMTEIIAGDAFVFAPNQAHQMINSGSEDLVYYVIADNPVGDSCYYPDSGKWKVDRRSASDRVVIKGKETDYFDGEE